MEGLPKNTTSTAEQGHNVENLADWRERKERAPQDAEKWISAIDGFEGLTAGKQVLALKQLQEELSDDNKNLYIDRVVAKKREDIMETMSDEERAEYELPLRTPNERVSKPVTPFPEVRPYETGYPAKQSEDHSPVDAEQRAA